MKNVNNQHFFSFLDLEFLWLQYRLKVLHVNKKNILGVPKDFFSLFTSKIIDVKNSATSKIQFSNKILLFMRLCKDSFQIQSRVKLLLFPSKMIEIQLRKQKGKPIAYCTLACVRTLCCICLGRCCLGLEIRVIIKISKNPSYPVNVD